VTFAGPVARQLNVDNSPRMEPTRVLWLLGLAAFSASCGSNPSAPSPSAVAPREVVFPSSGLNLHGYLWEPSGHGPFPAVLYNHGSEKLPGSKPVLGAFFPAQGFVFFVPHRRGQGLSPGPYISDLVAQAPLPQQNQVVVDQLIAQVDDVAAALTYLLGLPEIDHSRVVVMGCSYGGIETLLAAERDLPIRAAVDFAGAAESWAANPILQMQLVAAVDRAHVPIFFLQAMNDYDTTPSLALSQEMARMGKPYQVKIYPPYGTTVEDGHGGFCTNAPDVWGTDVLAFLRAYIP
jgi:carboxymethylenebutenolidase